MALIVKYGEINDMLNDAEPKDKLLLIILFDIIFFI